MPDLLNVGTQSVLTAQRQLNTTGHNISNVNTEGYSRQSVIQGPICLANTADKHGMGAYMWTMFAAWDQFAVKELNIAIRVRAFKSDTEQNLDMFIQIALRCRKKIPENQTNGLMRWSHLILRNDVGARKVVLEKSQFDFQKPNDFHETVRRRVLMTNKGLDVGIERINSTAAGPVRLMMSFL